MGESTVTDENKPGFIDTHCHLDFLFDRFKHSGSFEQFRRLVGNFPKNYEGCIAVFCEPSTFKQKWMWKPLVEEDGVWAAFDCHPHHCQSYTNKMEKNLCRALNHPKVRALGEIGLDYSSRNRCDRMVQAKVFRRQLRLAMQRNLPLVIHCREAHDCLGIMAEIVPRNHRIHLHCFTGTWTTAKMWMDAFPNLFIGITNVVTFSSATTVHETEKLTTGSAFVGDGCSIFSSKNGKFFCSHLDLFHPIIPSRQF